MSAVAPIELRKDSDPRRQRIGRIVSFTSFAVALLSMGVVWQQIQRYPRTDDAYLRANTIGMAPRVFGQIVELPIRDNQFVKTGELLYRIDPRPYEVALARAEANLAVVDFDVRALNDAVQVADGARFAALHVVLLTAKSPDAVTVLIFSVVLPLLVSVMLREAGCVVAEVEGGQQALDRLAVEAFDIVLLDISMPDMSGEEVCKQIRASETLKHLHVVAYTAHTMKEEQEQILAAGFDALLIKPINKAILLETLSSL